MSEINESCDISVLIFFDFWHSLLNAKSIIRFCKKHFTQLIKLTDIFNLINILISCFNATWSKTSLTSRSRQISVFSQLFIIYASCTKFNTASIADLWSTTRFICMRCWLRIFCKLCLSEELNNLINIDKAVTMLYSCIELTHSRRARQ